MGETYPESRRFDVVIIGSGILGASTAYFLSDLKGLKVAILDSESAPGLHASSRNTGVIHRPFYLNPSIKGFIAEAASKSYELWKSFAHEFRLPWIQNGTFEVANGSAGIRTIRNYADFARKNGMKPEEIEVLDQEEIRKRYPSIEAECGIFSRTDTGVDFGAFVRKLVDLSSRNGVTFLAGREVKYLYETDDGVMIVTQEDGKVQSYHSNFVVNVAGTGSLNIARKMGLALEFGLLLFRGDYWKVDSSYDPGFSFNLYSVPRYSRFPFLDPHFIIRWNKTMEVGPNASLVFSSDDYTGLYPNVSSVIKSLGESNIVPKISLFGNREFMSMVRSEWKSSVDRDSMAGRLRRYLPSLNDRVITSRGTGGIRGSLVDREGFVPEMITRKTGSSIHVLNYNSPGATGAPYVGFRIASVIMGSGMFGSLDSGGNILSDWGELLQKHEEYPRMDV